MPAQPRSVELIGDPDSPINRFIVEQCRENGWLNVDPIPRWKEDTTTTIRGVCTGCRMRSQTPYDGGQYCDGCQRRVTGPARCERTGHPIEDCEDCP